MDIHKRLSQISFDDFNNLMKSESYWSKLSEDEKIAKVNLAVQKVANLLNKCNYDDYIFDTINDSDLVLSPTQSGLESIYKDYIEINITSLGTITDNDSTAVNFNLESSSSSGTDPITYEINLTGASITTKTIVESSLQPVDWEKDIANNKVKIKANAGHPDFTVIIKNYKES